MASTVHEDDLDLSHLTSPEGLELPEHVGGCLDLSGLTTAKGLKLPLHVGGDIYLWSLDEDEYDQEVQGPRELNGRVHFHEPGDGGGRLRRRH